MYILPAIDLIEGKCVRLLQGRYDRQINYNDDVAAQAKEFIEGGAEWIHVVDLDGAKAGRIINTSAIAKIVSAGKCKIEVGGGIRDEQSIKLMLELGVERVIIGTKAANDFHWFSQMANKFRGKVALGLDAKDGNVAVQGWTEKTELKLLDFAIEAAKFPIAAIIYTDISKDGMMAGPNFERTKELADNVNVPIIASGGVNSIEDVRKLAQMGNIAGAIIGRSLYEGKITVAEAIKASKA